MNNIILFFLHPNRFYEKMKEDQLVPFVLSLIAFYSFAYVFWAIGIGPIFVNFYSLFACQNIVLDALLSLGFDLSFSVILSVAVYLFSKMLRLKGSYLTILFTVLSIELIPTLLMLLQLCFFHMFGDITHIRLWKLIGSIWQTIYLVVALRKILDATIMKAVFVAVPSIFLVFLISLMLFIIKEMSDPNAKIKSGLHDMATGDFMGAIKEFGGAINQDPRNAKNFFYLAEAYRKSALVSPHRRGEIFEKALEAYNESLSLDPNLSVARIGLGRLYAMNRRYDDALKEFDHAIALNPKETSVYKEIGRSYLDIDKPEIAKEYFLLASGQEEKAGVCKTTNLLRFVDKIGPIDGKRFSVESQIIWCIQDPILYWGMINDISLAQSRIHDVYYGLVLKDILFCEEAKSLSDDALSSRIVKECNESVLSRKFGIKIVSLNLKKIDGY